MNSNFIHVFHIGPEKTASTWFYRCMREHPELCLPIKDKTHYYNMFYHRGPDWLRSNYEDGFDDRVVVDPTPAYLHSTKTPERAARDNPDAKIIVTLRHPVERAFSHYWHSKKKGVHNYEFSGILDRYLLYKGWLEPGFYADHLERWMTYFPRERLKAFVFDDIRTDSERIIHDLFAFIGVDPDFVPTTLHTPVNAARPRRSPFVRSLKSALRSVGLHEVNWRSAALVGSIGRHVDWGPFRQDIEKLAGVSPALLAELNEIVRPEIERVERLLDLDLSAWRTRHWADPPKPDVALDNGTVGGGDRC